jgi:hypothetical protein
VTVRKSPSRRTLANPDGRIDVVAYARPDVADVPGLAETLVEHGDVDWRFGHND